MTKPFSGRGTGTAMSIGAFPGAKRMIERVFAILSGARISRRLVAAASLGLVSFVWFLLYRALSDISFEAVRAGFAQARASHIALAFAATGLSYSALAVYDILALKQVKATKISWSFAAFTAFIAQAFTFTLGFSLITGNFVRLRLYRAKGLQPSRVLAVGILATGTFWLGLLAAGSISLLLAPSFVASLGGPAPWVSASVGAALFLSLAAYIAYTGKRQRSLTIAGWEMPLPGPRHTLLSVVAGLADLAAATLALWILVPSSAGVDYPAFAIVFVAAAFAGVLSNVPGGAGVFEGVILFSFPVEHRPGVLTALLLFRVVYFLVPFALAAALFAIHEGKRRSIAYVRLSNALVAVRPFVPALASATVFFGGAVLLISGALPALEDRMAVLRRTVPLPFVETSHFLSSIVGALLLVVAYGLSQRLRSAWLAATGLLAAAAIFSLFKGIDYEEAILCAGAIGLLFIGREEFYRKGGILNAEPSTEWIAASAIAAGASVWIGSAIYHNVSYESHLWWDFAYRGDAPRFLRAALGVGVVFLIILSYRLLHKAEMLDAPATAEELHRIAPIVSSSIRAEANLALLGDKRILFDARCDGLLMYGVQGRTWVAMGDPIVPGGGSVSGLIWHFRELADSHRGVPVFYQATTAHLPAYLDAGFSMAKLGEEAWVDLEKFTLSGKEGRRMRQNKSAAERCEATFEIVPADRIEAFLPAMKQVSDAWLTGRGGREKGFSLGFWSESYLKRYDHALIYHFGKLVAFANIWKSAEKYEYSVDLMRHGPDAPPGMMDLLFIRLMEQAKSEGFRWFNLGMAPLSGLPEHRLASLWSRFGSLIFRYGGRFYNFAGLRSFKNKFNPEWRPRYLAYPGGTLPKVLVDVTMLIANSPARLRRMEGPNQNA